MSETRELAATMETLIWLEQHGALHGIAMLAAERRHQIELSYDTAHDRHAHPDGWLATEATLEAAAGAFMVKHDPVKGDSQDQLARSGALLAAEIDRLR